MAPATMPMKLLQHPNGLVLQVKVVPGASRDRIAGAYGEGIKVTVAKPPQAGAANESVVEVIAAGLQIPPANVQIIRGHTNPRKQVLIAGLTAEQIELRLLK
jgi:uncharacterized protein (TIGR00251 family)